ncbi:MAG: hypothetical protein ACRCW3_00060 [Metamycoplasmataceae bacterium]
MNQTFIDMLVAIKDPVAIEKAYNIMAAKRELLKADATPKFQHTFMEPRPVEKTYSQVRLEQEEALRKPEGKSLLRLVNPTMRMERAGFHADMVFEFIKMGDFRVICKHVRSGRIALLPPANVETFYKKPCDGRSPTECNCAGCIKARLSLVNR